MLFPQVLLLSPQSREQHLPLRSPDGVDAVAGRYRSSTLGATGLAQVPRAQVPCGRGRDDDKVSSAAPVFLHTLLASLRSTGKTVDNPRVCWDRSFHPHHLLSCQEDSHQGSSLLMLAGWWDIAHLVALMHHAFQHWWLAGGAAHRAHHFSSVSCLVILNLSLGRFSCHLNM